MKLQMLKSKPNKFLIKALITSVAFSYYKENRSIKNTEYLSALKLKRLQYRKLKKLLLYSYENVPYYTRIFDKIDFHPFDFKNLKDIKKLPFTDKIIFNNNQNELVSSKYFKKLMPKAYTGGTTGVPLMLHRNFYDYGRERAYTEYAYRMIGMSHKVKKIYMRGKVNDERGCYSQISDFGKTLYLSSHKMDDYQLKEYIDQIRCFKPVLYYTLPSVGVVLADYMIRNKIDRFKSMKWIFCPSENLYNFQKEMMEKAFGCKVGTFYGHSEHAVFATQCSSMELYHPLPQYGYFELIDDTGKEVISEGKVGEIVGSSFTNRISPLLRYRTGDYAVYTNKKCNCGRNYKTLKKIRGREQSIAIDRFNSKVNIGPELLCTIHDESFKTIKKFRFEQFQPGKIVCYIEVNSGESFDAAKAKLIPR